MNVLWTEQPRVQILVVAGGFSSSKGHIGPKAHCCTVLILLNYDFVPSVLLYA